MTQINIEKINVRKPKLNSRWRPGAERYSKKDTVTRIRTVKKRDGARRVEVDTPTEAAYVEGFREQPGWRNGARIRTKYV